MNIQQRVQYHVGLLMFKVLNDMAPEYMNVFSPQYSHYNLRSGKERLFVPKPRTNMCIQSLEYQGSKVWNGIPSEIKNLTSLSSFKFHFKNYIKRDTR